MLGGIKPVPPLPSWVSGSCSQPALAATLCWSPMQRVFGRGVQAKCQLRPCRSARSTTVVMWRFKGRGDGRALAPGARGGPSSGRGTPPRAQACVGQRLCLLSGPWDYAVQSLSHTCTCMKLQPPRESANNGEDNHQSKTMASTWQYPFKGTHYK